MALVCRRHSPRNANYISRRATVCSWRAAVAYLKRTERRMHICNAARFQSCRRGPSQVFLTANLSNSHVLRLAISSMSCIGAVGLPCN